jgi:AraC family transcriptional regulator
VTGRRRVAGLRREEVAELIGVSDAWYARFEGGRARMSISALDRLADALRLRAAERATLMKLAIPQLDKVGDVWAPAVLDDLSAGDAALPAYGAFCRMYYADVKQQHCEITPTSSLFTVFDRPAGTYVESPSGEVTLQMITRGFGGSAKIDFARGRFSANIWDGEFVVAPAGVSLTYDLSDPFDILIIPLPLERFTRTSDGVYDIDRLYAQAWQDPLVRALAHSMWIEAASGSRDGALFVESAAFTLSARLANLVRRAKSDSPSLSGVRLASVIDVMHSDVPVAHCSLEVLARAADMEPYDFLVAFRRATGTTPDQYLANVRVDRSRDLLLKTGLSITEIARHVGFDDGERYVSLFTTRAGCSPHTFRRPARGRAVQTIDR